MSIVYVPCTRIDTRIRTEEKFGKKSLDRPVGSHEWPLWRERKKERMAEKERERIASESAFSKRETAKASPDREKEKKFLKISRRSEAIERTYVRVVAKEGEGDAKDRMGREWWEDKRVCFLRFSHNEHGDTR